MSWMTLWVALTLMSGASPTAPVGSYGQPYWTTAPRFVSTHVYVLPAGTVLAHGALDARAELNSTGLFGFYGVYGGAISMGHGLQLDVSVVTEQDGYVGPSQLHREAVMLRWALADWDQLAGNPTVRLGLRRANWAPAVGVLELLLGASFADDWQWSLNVLGARELHGPSFGKQVMASGTVGYTLDLHWAIAAEGKIDMTDHLGENLAFDTLQALLGPSLQWRPFAWMYLTGSILFGSQTSRDGSIDHWTPTVMSILNFGAMNY